MVSFERILAALETPSGSADSSVVFSWQQDVTYHRLHKSTNFGKILLNFLYSFLLVTQPNVMFYKSFNKTSLLVLSISLIKTPIRCSHSNKKNLRKHPFLRSSFKW